MALLSALTTRPATRRWHRRLGLALLLPFFGWGATGLVFFIKPGYSGAYARLAPRQLPLSSAVAPPAPAAVWLETRRLRTVLGEHLLVRDASGWKHLHAESAAPWVAPGRVELAALIADAIASDAKRYGTVSSAGAEGEPFVTSTGVRITVDWPTLAFGQSGHDTELIDALYRVHYLQWTGLKTLDRVVGFCGLIGVAVLALFGLRLALK
ncbi:MAG: hypothetical protein ABI609_18105 [Acidobacteriota bacterium]